MIKVLAAMDTNRLAMMPDVQTIKEAGVDVPPFRIWTGFLAKAGTPPAVMQTLAKVFAEAATKPSVVASLAATGAMANIGDGPESLRRKISMEATSMGEMAKQLNLQPN